MNSARGPVEDVKPLALQLLEAGNIDQQDESPLFKTIPKEIRDLIFEYAIAAYPDPDRPYSSNEKFARPGVSGHPRIATELLSTCKAIYAETYQLPITINPVLLYHDDNDHIPPHARQGMRNLMKLASWQWAALHIVDISLQQTRMEGNVISQAAKQLQASLRYERSKTGTTLQNQPSASEQPQAQRLSGLEMPSSDPNIPRVIDRLTLRIGRTEWWTWEDPPSSSDHLGIDPGCGGGWVHSRCTTEKMIEEAEKRRQGEWEGGSPNCWGAQVADFKGLKELECIFETFALKVEQLNVVIECAKTWTFPMGDGYELRWDGKVESSSWTGVDSYGYEGGNQWLFEQVLGNDTTLPDHKLFEVRTIRFARRRCE